MTDLATVAPAFVEMAHRIVWCSVATVAPDGRPRTRILHPIWDWDGESLVGWIGTGPTPVKTADLAHERRVAAAYWAPTHDTCTADADTTWYFDDATCTRVWDAYKAAPAPLGYDPAMIPVWSTATDDSFAVLRLDPFHLRVFPGSMLLGQGGEVLTWTRA